MGSPTLDKTWQFGASKAYLNQAITATGTASLTAKNLLLAIKNSLIGMATLPWQIRGSSNGGGNVAGTNYDAVLASGAAGPNTDRWTSNASIVWANEGTAHSWIVLRQTGVGSTFEVLISCSTSAIHYVLTVYVSAGGFSGGTGVNRPTAADEVKILDNTSWGGDASDCTYRLHVGQSTDGQCTRVVIFIAGTCAGFWLFDKPKNPVTGWASPWVATVLGNNVGSASFTYNSIFTNPYFYGYGSAAMTMYATIECYNGTHMTGAGRQTVNTLSGEWPAPPMGLYSLTASNEGRHGELFDLRWAIAAHANGTGAPASGTYAWYVANNLWMPGSGDSTAVQTS